MGLVLTRPQAVLLLLVSGPHFEEQGSRSSQVVHSKDFGFSRREQNGH